MLQFRRKALKAILEPVKMQNKIRRRVLPILRPSHDYDGIDEFRPLQWSTVDTHEWLGVQTEATEQSLRAVSFRERVKELVLRCKTADRIFLCWQAGDRLLRKVPRTKNRAVRYFWKPACGGRWRLVFDARTHFQGDPEVHISPNGKYIAFFIDETGAEVLKIVLIEVLTGKSIPVPDELLTKSDSIAWLPNEKGFFFVKRDMQRAEHFPRPKGGLDVLSLFDIDRCRIETITTESELSTTAYSIMRILNSSSVAPRNRLRFSRSTAIVARINCSLNQ